MSIRFTVHHVHSSGDRDGSQAHHHRLIGHLLAGRSVAGSSWAALFGVVVAGFMSSGGFVVLDERREVGGDNGGVFRECFILVYGNW